MMVTETEPTYLTAKEAAKYLRVSLNWLYLQVAREAIPAIHVGRSIRFLKRDLDRWMAQNRTGPVGD
jgi:excisionase family DNA binding protein